MTTRSTKIHCGCIVGPWYCYSMGLPQIKDTQRLGQATRYACSALSCDTWPILGLEGMVLTETASCPCPHPSFSGLPRLFASNRKITGCHFKTHTKRMKITDVHLRSQWKNTSLSLHCTSPSSRPMKRLALKIVRSGERPHNMKWSQWRIWLFHILLNQKMNSNRDWLWLVNRCDSNLS